MMMMMTTTDDVEDHACFFLPENYDAFVRRDVKEEIV